MLQYALHVLDRQLRGYLHQAAIGNTAAVKQPDRALITAKVKAAEEGVAAYQNLATHKWHCHRALRASCNRLHSSVQQHTYSSTCCPSACKPSSNFALGVLRVVPVHTPRRLHTVSRALSNAAESGAKCVRP